MGCTPSKTNTHPSAHKPPTHVSSPRSTNDLSLSLASHVLQPDVKSQVLLQKSQPSIIINPSRVEVVGTNPVVDTRKFRFTELMLNSSRPQKQITNLTNFDDFPQQTAIPDVKIFAPSNVLGSCIDILEDDGVPEVYTFAYSYQPSKVQTVVG